MKTTTKLAVAAGTLALGGTLMLALAQDNGGQAPPGNRPSRGPGMGQSGQMPPRQGDQGGFHQGGPGMGPMGQPGQRPPLPPVIAALDANHDGVVDEKEIANASEALKKLDKDGDGKLSIEELMGPRPQMRGPGGPGGPGNNGPGNFGPGGNRPGNFPPQGRGPGGPGGPGGPDGNFPPGPPPGEGDSNNPPPGPPPGDN